jgi:hypothetical protein
MAGLDFVVGEMNYYLNQMARHFKPDMKLTFIARKPDNDNADFVLSSDDIDLVIKVLERRKDKP